MIIAVTFVCVMSHMNEFYIMGAICNCSVHISIYKSQSHHVNNFIKSHVKKCSHIEKESHRVNELLNNCAAQNYVNDLHIDF